jgi:hypothetical protein
LIVRELGPGPRRFTDLIDGLPGISRNFLTERLRDLERDGGDVRPGLLVGGQDDGAGSSARPS